MMITAERTAGEQEFINQKTRELMVMWCEDAIRGAVLRVDPNLTVYFEFAKSKKWISADGSKVLSAGWDTASRFLKR